MRCGSQRNVSTIQTGILALGSLLLSACSKPADIPADQKIATKTTETIQVSSPDIQQNGTIADRFSSYSSNNPPAIRWSAGPKGTQSYVLLVEDPDAPGSKPFVHWLISNIPPKSLKAPGVGKTLNNENGEAVYYGPHPPSGGAHHYLFQVFALDTPEIAATDRDSAIVAMKGHVLAKGTLTGLYQHQ